MSVIVMKVLEVVDHPYANALKVYKLKASDYTIDVIANLENIYSVGDNVIVALTGSVLKDGTKIKKSKIRGLYSSGMILGKSEDEIGRVLTEQYCNVEKTNAVQLVKWPSIGSFHNIRKTLNSISKLDGFPPPTILYRGKIKLHGTNAGVQIFPDGKVVAQSRRRVLTPEHDNMGFGAWVEKNKDVFFSHSNCHVTIFGEWCGEGIAKGVAISQIGRKIFAVFGVQLDYIDKGSYYCLYNMEAFVPDHPDIFLLPWQKNCSIQVSFNDPKDLEDKVNALNDMVHEVEKEDPWVKKTFNISGLGEGLVFYPILDTLDCESISELMFKAKGNEHKVVGQKQPVQIDPVIAKSIDDFVTLFLTRSRLEQGLQEACEGEFDVKFIGKFLKWVAQDVDKESEAELEASNLTWKQVSKPLLTTAREWYKSQCL